VLALVNAGQRGEAVPVEFEWVVMDVGALPRRADLVAVDAVLVGLGDGVVARVEAGVGLFDVRDADRCGQQAVDRAAEIIAGDRVGEQHGRDLRFSVDAGVGPAEAATWTGLPSMPVKISSSVA
jgi:hypothetical protein